MSRIAFLLLTAIASCSAQQIENPLDVALGDPFVLHASDGKFYMYGTSDGILGFRVYVSDDLEDWTLEGVAYDGSAPEVWGRDCFWAPEVYERDGRYYMFFSANPKSNPHDYRENFQIGVAVADSPTGPFKDMCDRPIHTFEDWPAIDANVLWDDDGKVYLYYSLCCDRHPVESEIADWARDKGWYDEIEESWVCVVELKPDFSGIVGEPKVVLRPPLSMDDRQSEWESRSVTAHEMGRRWTEGSFIFKHGDTYYMMYSANFFGGANYAVGYATSSSPTGPFTKADHNPVLERGGHVTGTGHNMVLRMADGRMWCVYHARTDATGHRRLVFIDPLTIDADGRLRVEAEFMK